MKMLMSKNTNQGHIAGESTRNTDGYPCQAVTGL